MEPSKGRYEGLIQKKIGLDCPKTMNQKGTGAEWEDAKTRHTRLTVPFQLCSHAYYRHSGYYCGLHVNFFVISRSVIGMYCIMIVNDITARCWSETKTYKQAGTVLYVPKVDGVIRRQTAVLCWCTCLQLLGTKVYDICFKIYNLNLNLRWK